MTKKMINSRIKNRWGTDITFSGYDLEGPLSDIIKTFKDLAKEYKGRDVRLEWRQEAYSDDYVLHLAEHRLETDKEYEDRLSLEDRLQAIRREQYERLKKEFEE